MPLCLSCWERGLCGTSPECRIYVNLPILVIDQSCSWEYTRILVDHRTLIHPCPEFRPGAVRLQTEVGLEVVLRLRARLAQYTLTMSPWPISTP